MGEGARISGVDGLKGIVIIGVVFVHLVLLGGVNREDGEDMPLIMQILYLGLMSFFIITGYFFRPGKGFIGNIRSRSLLFVALVSSVVLLPL